MRRRGSILEGIILGAAIGLVTGVGGFTFIYAKGASYLTDDPAACANCHIMREHLSGWVASSHRAVAVCNDCHTPAGFLGKVVTKVSNGFWHSVAFTTGRFPEPLRIKPHNRQVAERACRACHREVAAAIEHPGAGGGTLRCVRCHSSVGHLR